MDNSIKDLITKNTNGEATPEERAAFETWYNLISKEQGDSDGVTDYELRDEQIRKGLPALSPVKVKLLPRVAAVAAIALIVSGIWFFGTDKMASVPRNDIAQDIANDIAPGTKGATITLASGKTIALSGAKNGVLIGDELTYEDGTEVAAMVGEPTASQALTANTARGKTYVFTLPDGSKVWLNAASTLKFPSSFAGNEDRRVELSGEAYFEVAKNKQQPFVVVSKKQELRVLGTHFNVNSYDDESEVATTLLEGSVKIVTKGAVGGEVILKPGQQSTVTSADRLTVNNVDMEDMVDWKNDEFIFNGEGIRSIMKKVERWYDVDVEYEGAVTDKTFYGVVSKKRNISSVLKLLQGTGNVKFKVEGRKVTVTHQ